MCVRTCINSGYVISLYIGVQHKVWPTHAHRNYTQEIGKVMLSMALDLKNLQVDRESQSKAESSWFTSYKTVATARTGAGGSQGHETQLSLSWRSHGIKDASTWAITCYLAGRELARSWNPNSSPWHAVIPDGILNAVVDTCLVPFSWLSWNYNDRGMFKGIFK